MCACGHSVDVHLDKGDEYAHPDGKAHTKVGGCYETMPRPANTLMKHEMAGCPCMIQRNTLTVAVDSCKECGHAAAYHTDVGKTTWTVPDLPDLAQDWSTGHTYTGESSQQCYHKDCWDSNRHGFVQA